MSKILKRITAYTLAGAIVAGSFGGYSQVNAKAVDTSPKIIKHEKEKKYIIKANSIEEISLII